MHLNALMHALVIALYKGKGDNADINSYRGISILSPFAKVFERVLHPQITNYFNTNNLLFEGQHAFRSGRSTDTCMHEVINVTTLNNEKRLINLLLFIDFKKAFNYVDVDLLLLKLYEYGFSDNALKLISSYFGMRQQQVVLSGVISSSQKLRIG